MSAFCRCDTVAQQSQRWKKNLVCCLHLSLNTHTQAQKVATIHTFLLPVMRTRGFSRGGEEMQVSWLFHLLICLGKQLNLCLGKFCTLLRQPWQNWPSTAAVGMQTGRLGVMSNGSP